MSEGFQNTLYGQLFGLVIMMAIAPSFLQLSARVFKIEFRAYLQAFIAVFIAMVFGVVVYLVQVYFSLHIHALIAGLLNLGVWAYATSRALKTTFLKACLACVLCYVLCMVFLMFVGMVIAFLLPFFSGAAAPPPAGGPTG